MDKSYVTMEQQVCPVCGKQEDTGAILMDTRLRDRFSRNTVTGYGLCKTHQEQADAGYVFMIGLDPEKSTIRTREGGQIVEPGEEYRTGEVISIRKEAFEDLFDIRPVPPISFVDPDVVTYLRKVAHPSDVQSEEGLGD